MKITDAARDMILRTMRSKGLNPKNWYFELKLLENGGIGIGFNKDLAKAYVMQTGELSVAIDTNLDTTGIMVDLGRFEDKQGLVFVGER